MQNTLHLSQKLKLLYDVPLNFPAYEIFHSSQCLIVMCFIFFTVQAQKRERIQKSRLEKGVEKTTEDLKTCNPSYVSILIYFPYMPSYSLGDPS